MKVKDDNNLLLLFSSACWISKHQLLKSKKLNRKVVVCLWLWQQLEAISSFGQDSECHAFHLRIFFFSKWFF
jgi:hypothetical protein